MRVARKFLISNFHSPPSALFYSRTVSAFVAWLANRMINFQMCVVLPDKVELLPTSYGKHFILANYAIPSGVEITPP